MNLYAWTNNNDTIYTSTESPSSGDTLYNVEGEVTTSVGSYSNIEIMVGGSDSIRISVNGSSSDLITFSRDTEKDVLEPEPKYIQNIGAGGENYVIKAPSVVDNNSGMLKFWSGTKAEYDAITTKDNSTLYTITDDVEEMMKQMNARNSGEIVSSIVPWTDAGLHLLDGALINGGGIYKEFVDYVAILASAYPNLFVSEEDWQTSVSTYGVCGKCVYDSVNNTVRLPKYNSKIYTGGGTAPVVGNGKALGIFNGTDYSALRMGIGAYGGYIQSSPSGYGKSVGTVVSDLSSPSAIFTIGITTDPTKSGIIAQLSDITTSLDGYYYIVIATSTKTDIQVDIDEIATDLNGKADVDLTNVTDTAKVMMAGASMPSDKYINLTLGASGSSYIAPADGWVVAYKLSSAVNQYFNLQTGGATDATVKIQCSQQANTNSSLLTCTIPVTKGETFYTVYTAGGTLRFFRFYYAIGSESEAN